MIIAGITGKDTGRQGILLGVSFANLERLKAGEPIVIDENHPAGKNLGIDIFIFAGATELDIHEMLIRKGLIGPDTKQEIDPRTQINPDE